MFFFRKRISVETQLDELAKCGIRLEDGVTIEDVILEGGPYFSNRPPNVKKLRRELEVKPYDTIIYSLGGDLVRGGDDVIPMTNRLYHWDAECVHHPLAYAEVVTRLERMSGYALGLTDITGNVDLENEEFAFVEFRRAGETIRWDFEVDGDWMQAEIFFRFGDLMRSAAPHLGLYHAVLGTNWLLAVMTEEQFASFAKLSQIKFDLY